MKLNVKCRLIKDKKLQDFKSNKRVKKTGEIITKRDKQIHNGNYL